MALNNMGLGFIFTAQDLASGVMGKLEKNFKGLDDVSDKTADKVARSFTRMSMGVAMLGAGAGAAAGLNALANAAGEFEAAITSAGLIAGATKEQLDAMGEAALQAGLDTQFSPTEAAEGLQALAGELGNADQALKALNPSLQLASASLGQLSVEEASGLAVQGLNIFERQAEDSAEIVNKFAQLANQSSVAFGNMSLGLGNIARGAKAMHQELDTTLITLGLVKGTIPRIDSAATAASVAMERLVDPKHRAGLEGLGVKATNADGSFRDFLDIMIELQEKTGDLTDSAKSAKFLEIFGQEGLAGVQAVMAAFNKGVQDSNGNILKGRDALKQLREGMMNAFDPETGKGVASKFSEEMLKTFQGQKKLFAGAMQTLAIVAGKPLAEAFAPVVAKVTDTLNRLTRIIKNASPEAKKLGAQIAIATTLFLGVGGAILFVTGAMKVLEYTTGTTLRTMVGALLPLLPWIIAIGLAVAALKMVWDKNFGGIQEKVQRVVEVVTLAFEGLIQLFRDGGFSGAVMEALGEPENAGLKQFLIDTYALGYRVYQFFLGVWEGFKVAVEAAEPAFIRLWEAGTRLWNIVSDLITALFGMGDAIPSAEYEAWGMWLGSVLGSVLEFIINLITWVIQLVSGFIEGMEACMARLEPVFEFLWGSFGFLWDQIVGLINDVFGLVNGSGTLGDFFSWLGEVAGWLAGILGGALGVALGVVADILGAIIQVIRWVIQAFEWVADKVMWVVDAIFGASEEAQVAVDATGELLDEQGIEKGKTGPGEAPKVDYSAIGKPNPEIIAAVEAAKLKFTDAKVGSKPSASTPQATGYGASSQVKTVGGAGAPPSTGAAAPAGMSSNLHSVQTPRTKISVNNEETLKVLGEIKSLLSQGSNQPLILQVDGETVARITKKAQQSDDQRSYKNLEIPE